MLRSADELKDSSIAATNGEIGKTIDIYFDDEKLDRAIFVGPARLPRGGRHPAVTHAAS